MYTQLPLGSFGLQYDASTVVVRTVSYSVDYHYCSVPGASLYGNPKPLRVVGPLGPLNTTRGLDSLSPWAFRY